MAGLLYDIGTAWKIIDRALGCVVVQPAVVTLVVIAALGG
jgi:hypothetical protein